VPKNPGYSRPPQRRGEIAGVPTRLIGGLAIAGLALWFLLANLNRVRIQFWVYTVTAPLWIALATTLVVGFVLGYLFKGRRDSR
jgi:uncharacterized integral membrane protein